MQEPAERIALNTVLLESAKLSHGERHSRIKECVSAARHQLEQLPICAVPEDRDVRYCDHCWSVIDPHGLTWSWSPKDDRSLTAF